MINTYSATQTTLTLLAIALFTSNLRISVAFRTNGPTHLHHGFGNSRYLSSAKSGEMLPTRHFSALSSSVEDTSPIDTSNSQTLLEKIRKASRIVYKFSRPHTIKGTILASFMGVGRALLENPTRIQFKLIPRAIVGLIALLCGNAFIVGINQIYDVKIDEINKPFLPIAAKALSPENAWKLIIACLITGVSIVKTQFSPQIFALYMTGLLLGTSYSVPPFHLKRIPICASTIIAFVRGFLLNFGVYYAVREALEVPFRWNPVVVFISSFMTVFATVIAITKDLPDVEGDKQYDIGTFASAYGVRRTAAGSSLLLVAAYVAAIALPLFGPVAARSSFRTLPMVAGHSLYLSYFVWSYNRFDPDDMSSLKRFYKRIWNLFYMEYVLYPFI